MATLERAIEIVAKAHTGQHDKAGQPYILHPLRVMLRVQGDSERIVAVLHDVVEDTAFVKLADNAENMDLGRIPAPTAADFARLEEYEAVRALLLAAQVA